MKKTWPLLDLGKFIASLLIVYIHVPFFMSINNHINYWVMLFTRWAVPYFFIVSGFLFFRFSSDAHDRKQYQKKWMIKLIKTWIWWSAFYLVIRIIEIFVYDYDFKWQLKLIIRDFIFDGISSHLWYLPALVFSVVFVSFFISHIGVRIAWVMSVILFIIGLAGNTYSVLLPDKLTMLYAKLLYIIKYTRNGLFWAPILIMCGYELSRNYDKILKLKVQVYIGVLLFSTGIMLVEGNVVSVLFGDYTIFALDMWMFGVVFSTAVTALLIKLSAQKTVDFRGLREMSQYIYFIHPAYIYIMQILLGEKYPIERISWIYYIIVMSCTMVTAFGVVKLKTSLELKRVTARKSIYRKREK